MTELISSGSEQIANSIEEHLYTKIWQVVAENNVARMAPKAMNQEHQHAVQSFVYHNFAEKYRPMGRFTNERDPAPARMDSIAAGIIAVEHKQIRPEKSVKQSFMGDRSRSRVSENQIRSMKSNRVSAKTNKQITTEREITEKKQSFFISLGYEEEKEEKIFEKLRDVEYAKVEQQSKRKKEMEERETQRKLSQQTNDKLLKDKNLFTYNYEGELQEISYGKLDNDVRRMKEQLSNGDISPRQRKFVEATRIQRDKPAKQERQTTKLKSEQPQFSAKTLSIAQALADISKVAEGVKITDLKNGKEGITLQHKAKKLDGLKQYRLNDFKNIAKEKSFVEFSHSHSKKQSLDYSISELNMSGFKSKTTLVERNTVRTRGKSQRETKGRETHMILEKALGRGLPFIRTKGLRFNDLGMTSTFRTLQPGSTAKRPSISGRNRIKISDTSLYQQTFFH